MLTFGCSHQPAPLPAMPPETRMSGEDLGGIGPVLPAPQADAFSRYNYEKNLHRIVEEQRAKSQNATGLKDDGTGTVYESSWWDKHGDDIMESISLDVLIDALILSQ
jgi:hypothetical protein